MQPIKLCIFSGRRFEETFENTQWSCWAAPSCPCSCCGSSTCCSSSSSTSSSAMGRTCTTGTVSICGTLCSGFGISQESHCKELSKFADGLIVGSHFVKLMQDTPTVKEGIKAVCNRVKQFKAVL